LEPVKVNLHFLRFLCGIVIPKHDSSFILSVSGVGRIVLLFAFKVVVVKAFQLVHLVMELRGLRIDGRRGVQRCRTRHLWNWLFSHVQYVRLSSNMEL